ncbi:hypothetical protein IFM89_024537 [Coptis chinensis]|uniref:Cation efflux protein transmembrane domain-containing protein n=1 Tax=Coptis chinensis TaxID=261450 RepID=A0A835LWH6_9MAGN|nr:hypothetical protein IFM89_024537 [Coptis chinensis]
MQVRAESKCYGVVIVLRFGDIAAFAIFLFSLWASGWEATTRQSYGIFRIEILGALVSIQKIWFLASILVYEAIVRLIHDSGEVQGFLMFVVAAFGLGQGSNTASKNFIPFGGGMRFCTASEYTKLQISVVLHFLVTKYRTLVFTCPDKQSSHRLVSLFQTACYFMECCVLVLMVLIPTVATEKATVDFVFTRFNTDNGGGIHSSFCIFILCLIMSQYTLTGYDASAHMTEVTKNAYWSGPKGITNTIGISIIVGWGYIVGITFAKDHYVHVDSGSDILWVNCAGCSDCPKKSDLGVCFFLAFNVTYNSL